MIAVKSIGDSIVIICNHVIIGRIAMQNSIREKMFEEIGSWQQSGLSQKT